MIRSTASRYDPMIAAVAGQGATARLRRTRRSAARIASIPPLTPE